MFECASSSPQATLSSRRTPSSRLERGSTQWTGSPSDHSDTKSLTFSEALARALAYYLSIARPHNNATTLKNRLTSELFVAKTQDSFIVFGDLAFDGAGDEWETSTSTADAVTGLKTFSWGQAAGQHPRATRFFGTA